VEGLVRASLLCRFPRAQVQLPFSPKAAHTLHPVAFLAQGSAYAASAASCRVPVARSVPARHPAPQQLTPSHAAARRARRAAPARVLRCPRRPTRARSPPRSSSPRPAPQLAAPQLVPRRSPPPASCPSRKAVLYFTSLRGVHAPRLQRQAP
jgi:hypothetical protein